MNFTTISKLVLATLLLLCLVDFPYGYYQFVRFVATIGFLFFAFDSNQQKNQTDVFVFLGLALLFQPIEKISLGREIWNVVDVIVAILLIYKSKN